MDGTYDFEHHHPPDDEGDEDNGGLIKTIVFSCICVFTCMAFLMMVIKFIELVIDKERGASTHQKVICVLLVASFSLQITLQVLEVYLIVNHGDHHLWSHCIVQWIWRCILWSTALQSVVIYGLVQLWAKLVVLHQLPYNLVVACMKLVALGSLFFESQPGLMVGLLVAVYMFDFMNCWFIVRRLAIIGQRETVSPQSRRFVQVTVSSTRIFMFGHFNSILCVLMGFYFIKGHWATLLTLPHVLTTFKISRYSYKYSVVNLVKQALSSISESILASFKVLTPKKILPVKNVEDVHGSWMANLNQKENTNLPPGHKKKNPMASSSVTIPSFNEVLRHEEDQANFQRVDLDEVLKASRKKTNDKKQTPGSFRVSSFWDRGSHI